MYLKLPLQQNRFYHISHTLPPLADDLCHFGLSLLLFGSFRLSLQVAESSLCLFSIYHLSCVHEFYGAIQTLSDWGLESR